MTLTPPSPAVARRDQALELVAEHYVAGRTVSAGGERTVERRDPLTGSPAVVLVPATADEVSDAVAAADAARAAWRRADAATRAAALRRAASAVRAAAEQLGE